MNFISAFLERVKRWVARKILRLKYFVYVDRERIFINGEVPDYIQDERRITDRIEDRARSLISKTIIANAKVNEDAGSRSQEN